MNFSKVLEIKKKSDILDHKDACIIFIKIKPSKKLIALILDLYPNLKKIIISKNMAKYMKNYISVLKNMGINVKLVKTKKGRKGYSKKFKEKVLKYALKYGIKNTSKKFNVSKRSISYWRFNNNSSSHTHQDIH